MKGPMEPIEKEQTYIRLMGFTKEQLVEYLTRMDRASFLWTVNFSILKEIREKDLYLELCKVDRDYRNRVGALLAIGWAKELDGQIFPTPPRRCLNRFKARWNELCATVRRLQSIQKKMATKGDGKK